MFLCVLDTIRNYTTNTVKYYMVSDLESHPSTQEIGYGIFRYVTLHIKYQPFTNKLITIFLTKNC